MTAADKTTPLTDDFIRRWKESGAAERANYALFLAQLCDLIGVPQPDPATDDPEKNAYVFERDVTFDEGDGTTSTGRIDLYKRASFVLEAKQGSDAQRAEEEAECRLVGRASQPVTDRRDGLGSPSYRRKRGTAVRGTKAWDDAMVKARGQADRYARALPVREGWPTFLIVVDVGHVIELYSEFSRSGKTYVPFPDPQSFRIKLDDLADEKIRERLRLVWTDPLALDPSRKSAKVTRELAERLAQLAKILEQRGDQPALVARFLMRCLFTMFAEDVELIPKGSFKDLLVSLAREPAKFKPMVEDLWRTMDAGGFSPVLRTHVKQFNGGLFAEHEALPMSGLMLKLLIDAASADWTDVEPAIFGTLLERALNPIERHKLGAHYTPRAYVERLVMPTVIEPLREAWKTTYAAALTQARAGDLALAQESVRKFHEQLCETRVLDPACGSGNFLYVTLEHMKRLEGEVLNALKEFGYAQKILLEVDPHQFLGIEINSRAAAIADLVLWIGYLQWHFRTRGKAQPAEPIIKNYQNIQWRDAVLAWDRTEPLLDDDGQPVTRWDGRTEKTHPVTGEKVPDETARVEVLKYINPRKAEWPKADYVVGNPPFIGNKRMVFHLGQGYVDALRETYTEVPESADLVMYWWHVAAMRIGAGEGRRYGLITTNSITQPFNRGVVRDRLESSSPVRLIFAIPDHPWVEASDGAAVRIAMTVAVNPNADNSKAIFTMVDEEIETPGDEPNVLTLTARSVALINADLSSGADSTKSTDLQANQALSNQGVTPLGEGFRLTRSELSRLGIDADSLPPVVKRYSIGRDLVQQTEERFIIDFFGFSNDDAKSRYPALFQIVVDRVKPERDQKNRESYRKKWWIFAEPRANLRPALTGISRYIATCRTARHRIFTFLSSDILPDAKIVAIGLSDSYHLGILSSRIHVQWATNTGGWLGVGNDSNYNHSDCFAKFPFPDCDGAHKQRIRTLAEQLDAHRKRQQELHPKLTLTDMYNVLEKLRSGEPLSVKEKRIHDEGLVSVLKQIHDDLDAAVFAAYGWPANLTDEQILERLVPLNAERAAEEAGGLVRWLRPEFQNPGGTGILPVLPFGDGQEVEPPTDAAVAKKRPAKAKSEAATLSPRPSPKGRGSKKAWPAEEADRTRAIQEALAAAGGPVAAADLARQFQRARSNSVEEILEALVSLGLARRLRGGKFTAG